MKGVCPDRGLSGSWRRQNLVGWLARLMGNEICPLSWMIWAVPACWVFLLMGGAILGTPGELQKQPDPRGAPTGARGDTSANIERLIRQLGSDRFEDREQAAKELVAIGTPAIGPLRQALNSSDAEVVRQAKECIPLIERNLKINALIERLKDKRAEERGLAADGLREFGGGARNAVPALVKVLMEDRNAQVRERAAVALWAIGPAAKGAVPSLIELLNDRATGENLRWALATALECIGSEAEEAVPTLVHVLETDTPKVRKAAALALGKIGGKSKEVVPALIKILDYPEIFVQRNAAEALGMLAREPERCVPALVEVVKRHKRGQDTIHPCQAACWSLGQFGTHAKTAVPMMIPILKDDKENNHLRSVIIEALEEVGVAAKEAIPVLQTLRNDLRFTKQAVKALEAIGSPDK